MFQALVVFGSHWNAMQIDPEFLSLKQPPVNRYVFGVLSERADDLLKGLQSSRTTRGRVESSQIRKSNPTGKIAARERTFAVGDATGNSSPIAAYPARRLKWSFWGESDLEGCSAKPTSGPLRFRSYGLSALPSPPSKRLMLIVASSPGGNLAQKRSLAISPASRAQAWNTSSSTRY